jgi:hypothetical protein
MARTRSDKAKPVTKPVWKLISPHQLHTLMKHGIVKLWLRTNLPTWQPKKIREINVQKFKFKPKESVKCTVCIRTVPVPTISKSSNFFADLTETGKEKNKINNFKKVSCYSALNILSKYNLCLFSCLPTYFSPSIFLRKSQSTIFLRTIPSLPISIG